MTLKEIMIAGKLTISEGGGGGSGIQIGIADTPIPNILNMFYALENGTAKTGEFQLESPLVKNVETFILDTELTTIHGLFVADESQDTFVPLSSQDNTLFSIVFNPTAEGGGDYAATRNTSNMSYATNAGGASRGFLNRCTWRLDNGKLYVTAATGGDNYSPFYSGHTYRWVAW